MKCGFKNPAVARFCQECGASLKPAASQPRVAAPPSSLGKPTVDERPSLEARAIPEGERKTVTALFADIKGSMELMENLDPEEARAIVDPALRLMIKGAHRYDGYIVQSTGDGIFALFGAPVAHEDHPVRALYAALRMQEEMRRYADKLRQEGKTPVQVRIGVNTGEVVVRSIQTEGHAEYTPIGHSTGLAARLQMLANPGAVVIGESLRRLAEGYFQLKPLGPARIKGVNDQVELFEVTGLGPLRTRLQVAARRGLTRFVGRQTELALMRRALESARGGHGQIVAAMGEPGVGKSRLFHEFRAVAQAGCLVLEAYSLSHGKASAYLPVIEVLRDYFRITPEDDPRQRREKVIGKVLGLDRSLEDTVPYIFVLMGIQEGNDPLAQMDAQIRRRRTQDALKRILLRESLNQVVILVVEDLHWIDSETQALLNLLADSIANARILLLLNYRPEYRHEWGSRTYYTQLRLDPLGRENTDDMLAALLGDTAEMGPLKLMVTERSQGNPFFIEEIIHALFDDGVLIRNGTVKVARTLAQVQLPPTVQGILAARIDRLPSREKELLQTLAVIGRQFPLGLIGSVTQAPIDEIEQMLADLQHGEFIYEQPAFPEVEYAFKHALTQEVAYSSLLIERRKQLHEQAAAAIEALYAGRLDDHLSELVRQYSKSGDVWKAVKYLHLAAQHAARRLAYEETIGHLTGALDLLRSLPDDLERDRQELTLQSDLGEYLIAMRGPAAAEVALAFDRARSLCEKLGEDVKLFWVMYGLQFYHILRMELDVARELGARQLAVAERSQDAAMLMAAYNAMAETLHNLGDFVAMQELCEKGIALRFAPENYPFSEIGEPRTMILSRSSHALYILGYPARAIARSREALSTARRHGPHSTALALSFAAELNRALGDERTAQELAEALGSLSAERGFSLWSALAEFLRGTALIAEGQVDEGSAGITRAGASYEMTGAVSHFWRVVLAEAYGKAGRTQDGLEALAPALELADKTAIRQFEAELYRVKGELALMQALTVEAESAFRHAVEIARRQCAKSWELRATTSLARLLKRQGKPDEARAMLAEIYNWFTEGFEFADLKDAKALLDELST